MLLIIPLLTPPKLTRRPIQIFPFLPFVTRPHPSYSPPSLPDRSYPAVPYLTQPQMSRPNHTLTHLFSPFLPFHNSPDPSVQPVSGSLHTWESRPLRSCSARTSSVLTYRSCQSVPYPSTSVHSYPLHSVSFNSCHSLSHRIKP